jgi:hypothetical protein
MHAVIKKYAPAALFGVLCFCAGLLVSGQTGKALADDAVHYTFAYDSTFDKKWPISAFVDKQNGATLYINQSTGAIAAVK